MARKIKYDTINTDVAGAVSGAGEDLTDLGNEMREWYDNMPESLQNGDKGSMISEAADTLENVDMPDVPDYIAGRPLIIQQGHKGGRHGDPRWLRRDNAVSMLQDAVSEARSYSELLESALGELPDDAEDDSEVVVDAETITKSEAEERKNEVDQFADTAEEIAGNAEAVEFPGAFG